MHIKADALPEYSSQKYRDYLSEDLIFSIVKTRGVQIGSEYGEVFEVLRHMNTGIIWIKLSDLMDFSLAVTDKSTVWNFLK